MILQGDKTKAGQEFDAAIAAVARVLDTTSPALKTLCRPSLLRPLLFIAARSRLSKQAATASPVPSAPGLAVPSASASPMHKAFCFAAICAHRAVEDKEKKTALEQWLKLMPDVQAEAGVVVRAVLTLRLQTSRHSIIDCVFHTDVSILFVREHFVLCYDS